jgi:alpha-glucosidase
MGDELGMMDGDIPLSKLQDPQGINLGADKSRDPCRTPFQWNATPYAGFSSMEPWLPVATDYETRNVVSQLEDSQSILNLYRRLLQLRKEQPVLQTGKYKAINTNEPSCFAYMRFDDSQRYLILLNFSHADVQVNLEINCIGGHQILSTLMDKQGEVLTNTVALRPSEGIIMTISK